MAVYPDKKTKKGPLKNREIRAVKVFLIDERGVKVGDIATIIALKKAEDLGLDLVEIVSNVDVPVVKIMDFGKYRYEKIQKKKANKRSSRTNELKEIRFGFNIDSGDILTKMKQAETFLRKGYQVKVSMLLRGRQNAFRTQAVQRLYKIAEGFVELGVLPKGNDYIKGTGNNFSFIVSPNKK